MSNIRTIIVGLGAAALLAAPAMAGDPTDAMIRTATALTEEYNLPSGLLLSVAEVESDFDPNCRTGRCWGLMQIHSAYAGEYARQAGMEEYDLFSPEDSMRIAASMLAGYIDKYGSLEYALMCYNLGEAGARSNGGSSTWYSRKVVDGMDRWAAVEEATPTVEEATPTTEYNTRVIFRPDGIHACITGVWELAREMSVK